MTQLGADGAAGAAAAAGAFEGTRRPDGSLLAGTAAITDEPTRQALRVELSGGLAGGERTALRRLGQMFDIACEPSAVTAALGDLALRSRPAPARPVDPFEIAARAILGQQVTVAAARTLATRLVVAFGKHCRSSRMTASGLRGPPLGARGPSIRPALRARPAPRTPSALPLFPLPQAIAALEPARLGELGIIRTRAEAIVALAQALA